MLTSSGRLCVSFCGYRSAAAANLSFVWILLLLSFLRSKTLSSSFSSLTTSPLNFLFFLSPRFPPSAGLFSSTEKEEAAWASSPVWLLLPLSSPSPLPLFVSSYLPFPPQTFLEVCIRFFSSSLIKLQFFSYTEKLHNNWIQLLEIQLLDVKSTCSINIL